MASVKGNAEELAFLDALAGVEPTAEPNEKAEVSLQTEPVPVKVELADLRKGNADELAFLDDLAGVQPKEEGSGQDANEGSAVAGSSSAAPGCSPNDVGGASQAAENTTEDAAGCSNPEGAVSYFECAGKKEENEEEETYEMDATELLDAFKVEEKETPEQAKDTEDLFKDFMSELRSVDRDNEVNRILWAFKLNPFEKMNLRFTATASDVRKQYRKISLLIHPDKCTHPRAADAFEVLGLAQKELLNEEVRESLMRVLEFARDKVRAARRKATKHDSAMRLATALHSKGREGVEEEWEQTDDFHEKWTMTARDVLAKAEFRKRKLNKRIREETERVTIEEKEEATERKKVRKEKKEWLDKRTDRIDSWRSYTASKGNKKVGGIKAPKLKTADTERSYVQRNATEQFVGNYKKKAPK